MKRILISILAVFVVCTTIVGFVSQDKQPKDNQKQDDPFAKPKPVKNEKLDKLIGKWEGKGVHFGMEVTVSENILWTLNRQFIKIDYVMESVDKKFVYEATGFLRPFAKGKCTMLWLDDFGKEYKGESVETDKGSVTEWTEKTKDGDLHFKMEMEFGDKGFTETFFMKQGKDWNQVGKTTFTNVKDKEK